MKQNNFLLTYIKWFNRFFFALLGLMFLIMIIGFTNGGVNIQDMVSFTGIEILAILGDIIVTKVVIKKYVKNREG